MENQKSIYPGSRKVSFLKIGLYVEKYIKNFLKKWYVVLTISSYKNFYSIILYENKKVVRTS
jgi:hypothetical protein